MLGLQYIPGGIFAVRRNRGILVGGGGEEGQVTPSHCLAMFMLHRGMQMLVFNHGVAVGARSLCGVDEVWLGIHEKGWEVVEMMHFVEVFALVLVCTGIPVAPHCRNSVRKTASALMASMALMACMKGGPGRERIGAYAG